MILKSFCCVIKVNFLLMAAESNHRRQGLLLTCLFAFAQYYSFHRKEVTRISFPYVCVCAKEKKKGITTIMSLLQSVWVYHEIILI